MARILVKNASRSKRVKHHTPKYANRFFIAEAYALAKIRSEMTGVKHVVDHVIPLRGKLVSGLHVETNLQVIPAVSNLIKGNSFSIEEN